MTARLLDAGQVAELTGFSRHSILHWARRGELPSIKFGHRIRFDADDVQAWIDGQPRRGA